VTQQLKPPPAPENVPIGGAAFTVKYDNEQQKYVVEITSRTRYDGHGELETGLVLFVAGLQESTQRTVTHSSQETRPNLPRTKQV
jgi:hypothetical protein